MSFTGGCTVGRVAEPFRNPRPMATVTGRAEGTRGLLPQSRPPVKPLRIKVSIWYVLSY